MKRHDMKSALRAAVLSGMALVAFNAHAQRGGTSENWTNFGEPIALYDVSPGMAGTVVYRTGLSSTLPAVNIYLNGEYLGSLLENGYKYAETCPSHQRLSASFTQDDPAYRKKQGKGEYYDLPPGKVSFFKVVMDGSGKPTVLNVDARTAQAEMAGLRQQTHTLSRVSRHNCAPQAAPPMGAVALFEYNRSDYAGILPQSKQQISEVARDISNAGAGNVGMIHLEGHADPQGSTGYNDALAKRRANTVKKALAREGVPQHMIRTQGHGEYDTVVADCIRQYPANSSALNQCNQPNRRVEINIQQR